MYIYKYKYIYIPSLKLAFSPLKIVAWKTIFLLGSFRIPSFQARKYQLQGGHTHTHTYIYIDTYIYIYILPKFNIAPENRPSKKETIVFQPSISRCENVGFREGIPSCVFRWSKKNIQRLHFQPLPLPENVGHKSDRMQTQP